MTVTKETTRVARVAAQLSREDAGLYRTLDEIVADAAILVSAGDMAQVSVSAGRTPRRAYEKAGKIARLYYANIVKADDPACQPAGMVLGLRLTSGRHPHGAVLWIA